MRLCVRKMSELPTNWNWKTLPEMVLEDRHSIKRGPFGGSLKKEIFVSSGYKVYEQKNAIRNDFEIGKYFITKEKYEEMKAFAVKVDDIIISCSGTIGKIAIVPKDAKEGIINQALLKLSFDNKKVRLLYFKYLFESDTVQKNLTKISRGVAIKNVPSVKDLKQIRFPIPESGAEQDLIIEEIETQFTRLDAAIKSLNTIKKKLNVYRKSVLREMFKDKTKVKLEEISLLITKGASPKWQGISYTTDKTGVLFVTSENVRDGYLQVSKDKYVEAKFNEKQKRSILRKGDVLLNIVGASIGRAAIFDDNRTANINQAVALIRLLEQKYQKYLCYFLNSDIAISYYNEQKVDVARANLSLKDVSNIPVPICSVSEAESVVEGIESRFSVIDKLEQTISKALIKAEQLRKSILKSAFEGKLIKYAGDN